MPLILAAALGVFISGRIGEDALQGILKSAAFTSGALCTSRRKVESFRV